MKLKLLAFAFILAFAISTFGALGASGASAGPSLTVAILSPDAEMIVNGPDAATGGAVTAFTNVSANTTLANVDVAFVC